MSDKPIIFISHSSKNKAIAMKLGEQIKSSLGQDEVEVFISTDEFRRKSGNWFNAVVSKLDTAKAFIVLVTPASIQSQWVWFELGYFKAHDDTKPIYAVRTKTVSASKLPRLLKDLHIQVNEIDKSEAIEGIIQQINEVISISDNINEEYIKLKLETFVSEQNVDKWLLYRDVDKELELPQGSSARWLKEILQARNGDDIEENPEGIKAKSTIRIEHYD